MAQQGRNRRAQQRKAAPPVVEPDNRKAEPYERATHPGLPTYVLAFAVLLIALPWPHAIVDPTSVGGPARTVIPWLVAGFAFLSCSTLTVTAYCLLIGGGTEATRKFVGAVLNRAGIGAALGALVGLRVAPALLGTGAGHHASFTDCLSDIGNIVTMLTLMFIATVWPYSFGPLSEAASAATQRFRWLARYADHPAVKRLIPAVLLVGVNYVSFLLAQTVYFEVRALMS
jgi:hypothetical protein